MAKVSTRTRRPHRRFEDRVEPPVRQLRGRAPLGGSFGRETHLPESDPHEWMIAMCRVREAWQFLTTPPCRNVVTHPDTGSSDHPQVDAAGPLKSMRYDFVDGDPDPREPFGQGTATASVIVSTDDAKVIGAAEALHKRTLPPHAPARGVRTAGARQRVPTSWERIEALVPGAEPDRVQGVVRSLRLAIGGATSRMRRQFDAQ